MTAIVSARGLVKRYDGTLALGGLDLEIAAGEIFGLVGPNGAGKTTTLRILATLLARRPATPKWPGLPSAGIRTGCAASSGTCRTTSASTTT